jgi:rod shape-determining protein MreD
MRQKIIIFFLIFLAAVLEVSFLPNFFWSNAAPQLLLVMVVFWSSRRSIGLMWVILAAFVLDLLTFERLGFSAISFVIISYGVGFLAKRFFVSQRSRAFFSIAFFVLISTVFHHIYANFFGNLLNQFSMSDMLASFRFIEFSRLLAVTSGNLIIFSLVYWPLKKMKNIFPIEEAKLSLR